MVEASKSMISEEDVRSKVVMKWLAGHGFTEEDILVEFVFQIRLGRNIFTVKGDEDQKDPERRRSPNFNPRTDVLVRRGTDGANLLIVEVKAPDENISDEAKEQGLSYARLLRSGGIAPFVIITNGQDTVVLDSISGQVISDESVPVNHPYIRNNFRVAPAADDLKIRSDALRAFISLSAENLLAFCKLQCSERMSMLKSDDILGGEKYIPSLYVERREAEEELRKAIQDDTCKVIVVQGPPQVGKTNLMCHTVETLLKYGEPCLFYPAVSMVGGLLDEMRQDFNWLIHDNRDTSEIVQLQLARALERTKKRLHIFVDGWNEATIEEARAIDRAGERLSFCNIALVISMTNSSARRLLLDITGNRSYIARAANIDMSTVLAIEVDNTAFGSNCSIVAVSQYDEDEKKRVYEQYATAYNVTVSKWHDKVSDPFLIRIGMQAFSNTELPDDFDEPELIKRSIEAKAIRSGESEIVREYLRILAQEMVLNGAPIAQSLVLRAWNLPADRFPIRLLECALIARSGAVNHLPVIDFYYGRERNFVISYWARNWPELLCKGKEMIICELESIQSNHVGVEAARWFFSLESSKSYLMQAVDGLAYLNPSMQSALLGCLADHVSEDDIKDLEWLSEVIRKCAKNDNVEIRVEAAKLLALIADDYEESELASEFHIDKDLIINLLAVDEEHPLDKTSLGELILKSFKHFHGIPDEYEEVTSMVGWHESAVSSTLLQLLLSPSIVTRRAAGKALAYIEPGLFLTALVDLIRVAWISENRDLLEDQFDSLAVAVNRIVVTYYPEMCPSIAEYDEETKAEYYKELSPIAIPVIRWYYGRKPANILAGILEDLVPGGVDSMQIGPFYHPLQPPLPGILESD